jgi:hypothetical protein
MIKKSLDFTTYIEYTFKVNNTFWTHLALHVCFGSDDTHPRICFLKQSGLIELSIAALRKARLNK